MKGMLKGVATLAIVTVVATSAMQAQTPIKFGLGGGVNIPTSSSLKDFLKTGFIGQGLVQFMPANLPVGIQVDGNYSQLKTKTGSLGGDGKEQFIFGTVDAVYAFKTATESRFHPYLIGGGGVYNTKFKPSTGTSLGSTTKFGVNAGAGFDVAAGGATVYLEGRFHNVFTSGKSSNFVPIVLGVKFGGK